MELNIQTAELALREAAESNPGAWAEHSRYVAEACKNIASHCKDLSSEQAYIFGLLHDIGRYAGVSSKTSRKQFLFWEYCRHKLPCIFSSPLMFCFLPSGQSIFTLPEQLLTVSKKFFMFRMFSFTTLHPPPVNC